MGDYKKRTHAQQAVVDGYAQYLLDLARRQKMK
jgi:hypothetical protein